MACTKAASDLSCRAPLLPGLMSSRVMRSTLFCGSSDVEELFWAKTKLAPVASRKRPSSADLNFFMCDLLAVVGNFVAGVGYRAGDKRGRAFPQPPELVATPGESRCRGSAAGVGVS